jgi:glutaredoxin
VSQLTGRATSHRVTLITRAGCHLCEEAETALTGLSSELGFSFECVDVDGDPRLANEYSDRVPVILVDGAEHGYWRLEEARFRAAMLR